MDKLTEGELSRCLEIESWAAAGRQQVLPTAASVCVKAHLRANLTLMFVYSCMFFLNLLSSPWFIYISSNRNADRGYWLMVSFVAVCANIFVHKFVYWFCFMCERCNATHSLASWFIFRMASWMDGWMAGRMDKTLRENVMCVLCDSDDDD